MKDYFWGSKEEDTTPLTIHEAVAESSGLITEDNNVVEIVNNRIYFYSAVTRPKILKLNKGIYNLNTSMAAKAVMLEYEPPPIRIHINSYGGSVFAALSAVDYIKNSKIPVHSYIDGCAASAGTLISVVAEKRFMYKNSCMLVHQLSGQMWGKFQEMQDDMQNSEMLMQKIKDIYRQHTKIPKKELNNILKHDIWWEAEKCLEFGLVDELI